MINNPVHTLPVGRPSGTGGETFSRQRRFDAYAPPDARLILTAFPVLAGSVITSLSFFSGATALATPTNIWAALYSPALALLGQSPDETTGSTWAADSEKVFTLASPVTITADGWYYMGVMQKATTRASLVAVAAAPGASVVSKAPVMGGAYNSSLTSTAPSTASGFTATSLIYGTWS